MKLISEGKLLVLLCNIVSSGTENDKKVVRRRLEAIERGDLTNEEEGIERV